MTAVSVHPGLADPLVNELVHTLIRPERRCWTPAELRDLTSTVTTRLAAPLLRVVRYGHDRRWWARLALTDGVEVWLLSWRPGQATGAHDHGGAAGSFAVLLGEVTERYREQAGPVHRVARPAGSAVGFGADRVHDVGNLGRSLAASVHAYSPPLLPTRRYPGVAAS